MAGKGVTRLVKISFKAQGAATTERSADKVSSGFQRAGSSARTMSSDVDKGSASLATMGEGMEKSLQPIDSTFKGFDRITGIMGQVENVAMLAGLAVTGLTAGFFALKASLDGSAKGLRTYDKAMADVLETMATLGGKIGGEGWLIGSKELAQSRLAEEHLKSQAGVHEKTNALTMERVRVLDGEVDAQKRLLGIVNDRDKLEREIQARIEAGTRTRTGGGPMTGIRVSVEKPSRAQVEASIFADLADSLISVAARHADVTEAATLAAVAQENLAGAVENKAKAEGRAIKSAKDTISRSQAIRDALDAQAKATADAARVTRMIARAMAAASAEAETAKKSLGDMVRELGVGVAEVIGQIDVSQWITDDIVAAYQARMWAMSGATNEMTAAVDGMTSAMAAQQPGLDAMMRRAEALEEAMAPMVEIVGMAGEGMAGAAVDAAMYGESFEELVNAVANAAVREAAIHAVMEGAKALAAYALFAWTAAPNALAAANLHAASAAGFAAIGGVAAAVASGTGGIGGSAPGVGGGAPEASTSGRDFGRGPSSGETTTIINVHGAMYATAREVRTALVAALNAEGRGQPRISARNVG